ncbi:hypothetical protein Y1Q_0021127 [Alligator mississippiensis]|uniref:Uncharacterized protein n=1 Tax=Alligator mississippiensis TaxID=8496 RepID=A0A151MS80_ALLMI|nr:hypothetical protein Y1Q_0021127 [Alligator mississippiensis]
MWGNNDSSAYRWCGNNDSSAYRWCEIRLDTPGNSWHGDKTGKTNNRLLHLLLRYLPSSHTNHMLNEHRQS